MIHQSFQSKRAEFELVSDAQSLSSATDVMMTTSLIKWLVASAMAMCALTENGKSVMGAPTKLIIDTDAGFDVDDVGELVRRVEQTLWQVFTAFHVHASLCRCTCTTPSALNTHWLHTHKLSQTNNRIVRTHQDLFSSSQLLMNFH